MDFETVIGLEVHAQLLTKSKMFCRCSADYASAPPNTHVCPVCLGMPGVLPTINKQAVTYTAMTALALNCTVPGGTKFDRKNYSYPDLMKGYQISQYDAPVGVEGWLEISVDGVEKRVGIIRVHLEEDVAKLLHRNSPGDEPYSLLDVNRSGVPLMEIVGAPDLRSPEEARQYLIKLRSILQYLGVSTGNMEEGSFRCDANISIRPPGTSEYLAKVEVKNMNSFKAVYRALEFEAERQRRAAKEGKRLVQETRGWVEESGKTVSMRSKEYAHDYRYFPEPDLPPLNLSAEKVAAIRASLPELPDARRQRFITDYGLTEYDACLIITSKSLADYFEACLETDAYKKVGAKGPKEISNWLLGEVSRIMNAAGCDITTFQDRVGPAALCELVVCCQGTITAATGKTVLEEMYRTGKPVAAIITEQGLGQISDTGALEVEVAAVIKSNPRAVADYKTGKVESLKFLVGQVMRATKGRVNPGLASDLLKRKLEEG